tara:strand:+ start:6908 stop:7756 length:849 start_codon:yes stop_codon:yes gene_type:complete
MQDKKLNKNYKVTPEYLDALQTYGKECHVESKFAFLRAHNGLRKGNLHVMMGSSHSGKSTLVRSLLLDALDNNPDKTVLLFLSEESTDDFLKEFAETGLRDEKMLQRLHVISALDGKNISLYELKFMIKEIEPDLFFFDNLTTSDLYADCTPKEQTRLCNELKNLAKEIMIPFFLIVHTGKEIMDNMTRLIEMNDVRGSKSIVNIAEFFYIAQSFHTSEIQRYSRKEVSRIDPTICIKKHRGENVTERLFYMNYCHKKRIYVSDKELEFSAFKEMFKNRNRL